MPRSGRRALTTCSLALLVLTLSGCTASMVRRHGGPFEDPALLCIVDPNDPPPPPLPPRVPPREHPRSVQEYKGYEGAYRGRVVDADTGQPLAGAAVAAVWHRQVTQLFGSVAYFYAACEVLTDANGDFVLDAKRVERDAPSSVGAPRLHIYFPGYNSIPRPFGPDVPRHPSVAGDFLEGSAVVELPRMTVRKERLEVVSSLHLDAPERQIPNLIRLVNVELARLGLRPIHMQEAK